MLGLIIFDVNFTELKRSVSRFNQINRVGGDSIHLIQLQVNISNSTPKSIYRERQMNQRWDSIPTLAIKIIKYLNLYTNFTLIS